MKNFEERKTEIFRRSAVRLHEKREKKKKYSRVSLSLLPVFMCLVIAAVGILPRLLGDDRGTDGWGSGWFAGETNDFPTMGGHFGSSGEESLDTEKIPQTSRPPEIDALEIELLSARFTAEKQYGKTADEAFARAGTSFALSLFQKTVRGEKDADNVMVSPLSVWLALSMTANGASGETRAQMERLLGGDMPLETLNEYLYAYVKNMPVGEKYKLSIANSIWTNTGKIRVKDSFLQTNADYYDAAVYSAPFDTNTVLGINNWVRKNTDGMIDEMLDQLDPSAVMYLINTLLFEADWMTQYSEMQVGDGSFTTAAGKIKTVSMMHSSEYVYLEDGKATGFIKNFAGSRYSFAALLPNKGVDIYDYIASLSAEGLRETLRRGASATVDAAMPKFEFEYAVEMRDVLESLGVTDAFDASLADFSALGRAMDGNIYLEGVEHKTYITVGELGARAGAATAIEPAAGSAPTKPKTVTLDRPFVYMILDNDTGLPIFMGAVTDIGN